MQDAILNFEDYEFPVGEGIRIGEWKKKEYNVNLPEKLVCFQAEVYKADLPKEIGILEAIVKDGEVLCITAFIDGFEIRRKK